MWLLEALRELLNDVVTLLLISRLYIEICDSDVIRSIYLSSSAMCDMLSIATEAELEVQLFLIPSSYTFEKTNYLSFVHVSLNRLSNYMEP